RLAGYRAARRRAARLALQRLRHGARHARPAARAALAPARFVRVFRATARARFGLALARRRQVDARAPRLRQAGGDRLPWRARSVLAAADLVDLLADELARLGRGRLALALVLAGLLDGSLVRHRQSPRVAVDRRPRGAAPGG